MAEASTSGRSKEDAMDLDAEVANREEDVAEPLASPGEGNFGFGLILFSVYALNYDLIMFLLFKFRNTRYVVMDKTGMNIMVYFWTKRFMVSCFRVEHHLSFYLGKEPLLVSRQPTNFVTYVHI